MINLEHLTFSYGKNIDAVKNAIGTSLGTRRKLLAAYALALGVDMQLLDLLGISPEELLEHLSSNQ